MSIEILKETGAVLEGHFLLSSGRHSDRYAQNAKLLQYPDKAAEVLAVVAEKVKDLDIDVVCGPAMGGIIVAYELGRQLGKRAIFTERENNVMTLRRGFEIKKGEILANILNPLDCSIAEEIKSPVNGTIFFTQSKSLAYANAVLFRIIPEGK